MSNPNEPKIPAAQGEPVEAPTEPDELTAEDLESVAGGVRMNVSIPKLDGSSKDG